jgi:DNA polymerase (family 10)
MDMTGVTFKSRAYENAAHSIESLALDFAEIYEKGGLDALKEIPRVGESIARKIEELLNTEHLEYYEDLGMQMREIDKVNKSISCSRILKGCEANIQRDGSLDLRDSVLAELDIVGAAVHSWWDLPKAEQTKRLVKDMVNDDVDFIIHTTSREIGRRAPIQLDFDRDVQTAKDTGTILEIDSHPNRPDLKDNYARRCIEAGVKLSMDTDAHARRHLHFREFGVATARRGWTTPDDIVNTRSVKDLLDLLK